MNDDEVRDRAGAADAPLQGATSWLNPAESHPIKVNQSESHLLEQSLSGQTRISGAKIKQGCAGTGPRTDSSKSECFRPFEFFFVEIYRKSTKVKGQGLRELETPKAGGSGQVRLGQSRSNQIRAAKIAPKGVGPVNPTGSDLIRP